ncbi:MAG TPA: A/G-specific adenine glycosylase [Spirochaetota bacterium]
MRTQDKTRFRKTVLLFYKDHFRPMPWREDPSPYHVFVSEIMLQQTSVERVLKKFSPFVERFPDFQSLAAAPLADVFTLWQGLGYNRRARFMRDAARIIVDKYNGILPKEISLLEELPGIGRNTAAAIIVYAWNIPVPYVETNIRSIFIHHFFREKDDVTDNEILPLVAETLDQDDPRQWFWALMDYGADLKKRIGNTSRRSKTYRTQTPFHGSDRMVRGIIIRVLAENKKLSFDEILVRTDNDPRTEKIVALLVREGLVCEKKGTYRIEK